MVTNLTIKQLKYIGIGVIGGSITGYIVQILCQKYLKNHPELLEHEKPTDIKPTDITNKPTKPIVWRRIFFKGGGIEVVGLKIGQLVIEQLVIPLSINGGGILGIAGGGVGLFIFLKGLPRLELIKWLNDASPANLDSNKVIALDTVLEGLESCENNLEYLCLVLKESSISIEEKKDVTKKVLAKFIDFKSHNGRLKFILCIVSILFFMFNTNISNFYLLMQALKEAVRKGKISKAVARLILRRLRRKGIPVDPDFVEDLY